jgi:hypothetical protein
VKVIRIARAPALLLALGLLLAGCSIPTDAGILAPTVQGPPGHQFTLSFLRSPGGLSDFAPNPAPIKGGPEVGTFARYAGGGVDAFVYELMVTVPRSRAGRVLRSFLPTSRGARTVTWRGYPAAAETVPCATSDSSCSGVVNVLVVLRENTIYEVMVNAPTNSAWVAVYNSFRFIE